MVSKPTKKRTYGGVPVSDEYLARYRVSSDQEVYGAILLALVIFGTFLVIALAALWVWA